MRGVFCLSTLLFLPNLLPIALSVPVLLFLAGYSFAKRFTMLVHYWLGARFDARSDLCLDCVARRIADGPDKRRTAGGVVVGSRVLLGGWFSI